MNQTAPKFIGKRISTVRSKEDIVITITQQVQRWQETLLLVWLMGWTFCGVVFIKYAIQTTVASDRIFFIVCSALWAYFFVKMIKVLFWRKGGREIIRISKGKMELYNAFWKKSKLEEFQIKQIFKLGLITRDSGNFLAFLDDSFWIIGGERVGFNYNGSKRRLGKQLERKDAELLIRVIESAFREFGKD